MAGITFSPLINGVVLRLEPEPPQSSIIQVQKATEGLCRFGEVLAIGPEVRDVKVGMKVLASVTAGTQLGEEQNMLVREDAVLAIRHE